MSPTRTITVDKQTFAPAREITGSKPGLKMDVTYGYYLNVEELNEKAKDWTSSVLKSLPDMLLVEPSDESMRGVKYYSAVATGYVNIPEDGIYYFSTENEEVWIDGKLLVNNGGEVKRFSGNDSSAALAKGLHEFKVVFLSHIIGGWPSIWNNWHKGTVNIRKSDEEKFSPITSGMLCH
jgi:hexosaminidase